MVKAGIDVVRLPKVESAQMMLDLVKVIEEAEAKFGVSGTKAMAAIESARGGHEGLGNCRSHRPDDRFGPVRRRLHYRHEDAPLPRRGGT